MLISFIDVLYGIVIGVGFTSFPKNPINEPFGACLFLSTLLLSAQDWYEYHINQDAVQKDQTLFYFFIQILVILALNQMFVHATMSGFQSWMFYLSIFTGINVYWNISIKYENHYIYAISSAIFTLLTFTIAINYDDISSTFEHIKVFYIILLIVLVLYLVAVNIVNFYQFFKKIFVFSFQSLRVIFQKK